MLPQVSSSKACTAAREAVVWPHGVLPCKDLKMVMVGKVGKVAKGTLKILLKSTATSRTTCRTATQTAHANGNNKVCLTEPPYFPFCYFSFLFNRAIWHVLFLLFTTKGYRGGYCIASGAAQEEDSEAEPIVFDNISASLCACSPVPVSIVTSIASRKYNMNRIRQSCLINFSLKIFYFRIRPFTTIVLRWKQRSKNGFQQRPFRRRTPTLTTAWL